MGGSVAACAGVRYLEGELVRQANDKGFDEVYKSMELNGSSHNGGDVKHGRPKTFTAAELLALELPEVRWTVPDILPEGITLMAGKPKLGKSWAALGLCIAVATGGVALGKVQVERGEALYLALEDNHRRLKKRLLKLLAGDATPEKLR
jgi:hypothetical protein